MSHRKQLPLDFTDPRHYGCTYSPLWVAWQRDRRCKWQSCGSGDTPAEARRFVADALVLLCGEHPDEVEAEEREGER